MSRSNKQQFSNTRAATPRKVTKKEFMESVRREIKRRMIADGLMENPATRDPKFQFHWSQVNPFSPSEVLAGGVEKANTKGEAIAQIKRALGIPKSKRIPATVTIVRVPRNASTPAVSFPATGVAA